MKTRIKRNLLFEKSLKLLFYFDLGGDCANLQIYKTILIHIVAPQTPKRLGNITVFLANDL